MKKGRKSVGDTWGGAIRSLAKLGKSADQIAAFVDCNPVTIQRYCHQLDIPLSRKGYDSANRQKLQDRDKSLCDLFLTGKTLQEVGTAFKITRERVRQILNKYGISERYLWTIANSGILDHVTAFYEAGETWEAIEAEFGYAAGTLTAAYRPTKVSKTRRRAAEFWRQVAVSANEDRCWLWTGSPGPSGYGRCSWKHRYIGAHVLAFILTSGKSSARWVLHRCDNPACCNPKHLYEGTAQDNVRDRDARGRGAHQNGRKLCDHWLVIEEVERIRQLLRRGVSQMEIAKIVGVSFALVNGINTGRVWANPKPVQAISTPTFKAIYEGLQQNAFSQAYVSRTYGLAPTTVKNIKSGNHWRVKKTFPESQMSA